MVSSLQAGRKQIWQWQRPLALRWHGGRQSGPKEGFGSEAGNELPWLKGKASVRQTRRKQLAGWQGKQLNDEGMQGPRR